MEAMYEQHPNNLILLLIILAIVLGLAAIPLTRHASQERVETKVNASVIVKKIESGNCYPIESYYCEPPNNSHYKVICQLSGNIWAGLLVGVEGGKMRIISGYPARREYWDNAIARDGCIGSVFPLSH